MSADCGFRRPRRHRGRTRSDRLDTEVVSVALWDGGPGMAPEEPRGRSSGGARRDACRSHRPGRVASASGTADRGRKRRGARSGSPIRKRTRFGQGFDPKIVGLLFADARGFSTLTEKEVPLFVEHFLGTVAAELARCAHPPVLTNTWGDGLYFVFENVRDTGEFALDLCDAIRNTDWKSKGFSHDLSLRIGLHAGPTFECLDQFTRTKITSTT